MLIDAKKYNAMEPVLNGINKSYVSLSDEDIKRNNDILKSLLDLIINKMKEKDSLFNEMFSRVFFGGSFYDGLRIGQPDEYDLDLLLSLPKLVEPTITTSDIPGYVHLQFKEYIKFLKEIKMAVRYKQKQRIREGNIPESHLRKSDCIQKKRKNYRRKYGVRGLDKLIDEKSCFLDTNKVLQWMESLVNLALNDFEKQGKQYVLNASRGVFYARVCKGGPAFTLKVNGNIDGANINLDVDLVPCFVFGKEKWPVGGFRKNPIKEKPEFFIVPKPLKGVDNSVRYWRLSFQEQERVIINRKKTLKPTVKLLKKMTNTFDHKCIASYYLKTIILWQSFEERDEEFWENSLSYVFMTILKEYYSCLSKGEIAYFWNADNNLIKNINKETIINVRNRIKAVIDDIEKHPEDPFVVVKYLLRKSERDKFITVLPNV